MLPQETEQNCVNKEDYVSLDEINKDQQSKLHLKLKNDSHKEKENRPKDMDKTFTNESYIYINLYS